MDSERTLRMTPQRQVIMEELEKARSHPTADEIYDRVRRRMPRISLGTVYRNLELLASHGLIQRLDLGGNQRRFELNPELHYHVRCLQCGTLADVTLKSPFLFKDMITNPGDFEIFGVRLEFLGLCQQCKQKRKATC